MRQAIVTKYLGPTNFRGARVKATAYAGSLTLAWDDALDVSDNHQRAADTLAKKLNWLSPGNGATYTYVGGSMPDDTGYAFVQVKVPR